MVCPGGTPQGGNPQRGPATARNMAAECTEEQSSTRALTVLDATVKEYTPRKQGAPTTVGRRGLCRASARRGRRTETSEPKNKQRRTAVRTLVETNPMAGAQQKKSSPRRYDKNGVLRAAHGPLPHSRPQRHGTCSASFARICVFLTQGRRSLRQ